MRSLRLGLLAMPLVLFCSASPWLAQDERFVLEPGEHSVLDVILKSGKFLNRTYLVDRTQCPAIDPKVSQTDRSQWLHVSRKLELDAQGCEEVIGQMLRTKGWVALPVDRERGVYDWVWEMGPKGQDIKRRVAWLSPEEIRERPMVAQYVITSVRLEFMSAQVATVNLRVFFNDPRGLTSMIAVDHQSMLISGWRSEVAAILGMLQKLDVAPKKPDRSLEDRLRTVERRLAALEKKSKG